MEPIAYVQRVQQREDHADLDPALVPQGVVGDAAHGLGVGGHVLGRDHVELEVRVDEVDDLGAQPLGRRHRVGRKADQRALQHHPAEHAWVLQHAPEAIVIIC